jgi:hypothetical protein
VRIFLLVLILLVARPAWADFTTAEKAEIAKLVGGRDASGVISNLVEAMRELSFAFRDGQGSADARRGAAIAIATALLEAHITHSKLQDVDTDAAFTGRTCSSKFGSRAACLADPLDGAWFHLARVSRFIGEAQVALASTTGGNASRVRTIWLRQAQQHLKTFNTTLPYAAPRTASFPKIITVHGHYDAAQWEAWRAGFYATDAFLNALGTYPSVAGTDYPRLVLLFGDLHNAVARALARASDVDTRLSDTKFRAELKSQFGTDAAAQFFLILGTGQEFSDFQCCDGAAVSERFFEFVSALMPDDHPLKRSVVLAVDSWRHADKWVWEGLLTFPGCSMSGNPSGCAATLPTSQPVTTGLSFGATVSGKPTLTATSAGGAGITAKYTLLVDGAPLASNTSGTFTWDTTAYANGPHTVSVTAVTASGKTIVTASTVVTVANRKD